MKKIFMGFFMLILCLNFVNAINYESQAINYESQYPLEQSSTYVRATTYYGQYLFEYFATNPLLSLVGGANNNAWESQYNSKTNQRFHIDLSESKVIKRIYYENLHSSGSSTGIGVQNFTFWGSNSSTSFNTLTYVTDTGWTQLTANTTVFDIHKSSDAVDPKYVEITNNNEYRYYAFKFADNYGTNVMGLRRIELQTFEITDLVLINSTYVGRDTLHSLEWESDIGLSGYIFSFDNGTGTLVNDSWVAMTGTNNWSNVTKTINSTIGATIRWCVYANDTSNETAGGNWNTISCETPFSYVTLDYYDIIGCSVLNIPNSNYKLTIDILNSLSSVCIDITANNIAFDCQYHIIDGSSTADYGIRVYRDSAETTNATIKNCVITDWTDSGIYLRNADGNNLTNVNNSGTSAGAGIALEPSSNNVITNIKSNSSLEGIFLRGASNNIIKDSIFSSNQNMAIGMGIVLTLNNTIENNIISDNGINLYGGANGNVIRNNTIESFNGIIFVEGYGTISGVPNQIYNNLFNSTNGFSGTNYTFYLNTTKQFGTRIYGNGTEIGGNYWTNSTGNGYSDMCIDADRDGFCDNLYILETDSIDYLPLSDEYIEPECLNNSDCALCEKCSDNFCINQTDIEDLKDECILNCNGFGECYIPECLNNSDCNLCEKCIDNFCINQTNIEDLKDECNLTLTCNGFGECNIEEPEEPEEPTEEINFNIESKIFMLITILIIFSIAIFLFDKFGKKGMSKLSIFLIIFFALSLKVFAVTNNYVMESNLLTIVTIILIIGLIYFIYQKIFKKE